MEIAEVSRLKDHVEHHLLGDGVADLNRAAGGRFALGGELDGAEGGAVDAVAAGAAADRDDQVARSDVFDRHARGSRPTVPQKTRGLAR